MKKDISEQSNKAIKKDEPCGFCGNNLPGKYYCSACKGTGTKDWVSKVTGSEPTIILVVTILKEINIKEISHCLGSMATTQSLLREGDDLIVNEIRDVSVSMYDIIVQELLNNGNGEFYTFEFVRK